MVQPPCKVIYQYKKVLLRERKRYTARRIASACYAALSPDQGGYPNQLMGRGYSIQSWTGGTPFSPGQGGYPTQSWTGGYPSVTSPIKKDEVSSMGYPSVQTWDGVPPWSRRMGHPPHQLDGVPPPSKVEQTDTCENITSSRTTYAGGNE